jgi:cation/acetate symporter
MEQNVVYQINNIWLGLVPVVLLFTVYYTVAIISNRKTTSYSDVLLAGRSIPAWVNGMASAATWMSLATFLGVVALILKLQMPFVYLWIQFGLSVPLLVLFYGAFLHRMGVYTTVSFVRERYGTKVSYMAAVWMIVILFMYVLSQMIGVAKVFETLIGLPYFPSLVLGTLLITLYISIGGMRGATYNDAIQVVVMAIALIVPTMAILKALGATGWFFPPLGYGGLTEGMKEMIPTFFNTQFDFRYYLALLVCLTLGTLGLPHLAMRVYTSPTVKQARRIVPWFLVWVGLLFSAVYAIGFAGVYHFRNLGIKIPMEAADKTTILLNLAYNPDVVTGFVIAGALAAGVSTIAGLLMGIAGITVNDLISEFKPDLKEKSKVRLSFVTIFAVGIITLLVALKPPSFLVASMLWAFGLCATAISPLTILGVWSTRINKYGAVFGSMIAGLVYIVASPYVFPTIVMGPEGIIQNLGLAAGLLTVPLSFILTILGSLIAERIPSFKHNIQRGYAQHLVEKIHGWKRSNGRRYGNIGWLIVLVIIWVPIMLLSLKPWN